MGELPALRDAIRSLHGCDSIFVESVPIVETFEDRTVWDGSVYVFDLVGCARATRAYAWSHAVNGSEQRVVVILHDGFRVVSPRSAVRTAIVERFRAEHS